MYENRKLGIEQFLDPLQEKKMKRLKVVMDMLKSFGEIEENRFCGMVCVNYGIRRQTLMEYLKDLEDYSLIQISDGKIKWVGEEPEEEGSS